MELKAEVAKLKEENQELRMKLVSVNVISLHIHFRIFVFFLNNIKPDLHKYLLVFYSADRNEGNAEEPGTSITLNLSLKKKHFSWYFIKHFQLFIFNIGLR